METVIVTTIIIAIPTIMLAFVAGVWLPSRFRKEDKTPKISISPFQERQNYFDITNHGGDILNLKIEIFWLQDGAKQNRKLTNFFNFIEDPTFGQPHNCNALGKGETKKITDCPLFSDDGKIEISISGTDVTKQMYRETLILKNNFKRIR